VLKDFILSNSNAVRTLVHPDVRLSISDIQPDIDSVTLYKTNIVEWLKPIIDLSDFYVYPTNGVTEGLNWWMSQETRAICMDEGDYQWVKPRGNIYEEAIKYMSVPSAIDGNFREIPKHVPIALDLAYIGSTTVKKLNISSNVEYVFYSLSKPFGVRNVRTGWMFTRQKDFRLDALIYNAKYYNYYANQVAEKIINNFDIDFVHKMYYNKQKYVCDQLNITPSDSVWIGTSTDAEYAKYRRSGDTARLCLAGVYNEET